MKIEEKIKNWIKKTLNTEVSFVVEHPADLKNGDYSTNIAMILAGKEKKNPKELASEFGKTLNENIISEIEKVEAVGGFINFYLSKNFFENSVKEILDAGENCGQSDLFRGKDILVEHTQPNPFKEFHIGHLMNNAIGESIARIVRVNGANTKVVSYHGDVGLHVAKTIWGKMKKPELSWGEAYAYGAKNFDENKDEITSLNVKIFEKKDENLNKLYQEGLDFSLKYFDSIYSKLDSHFDNHFYENVSGKIGKEIVMQNVGKVFEESEKAIIFRGENFEPKTHTRVFVNSEGIPTYEAKEVGLAKLKKEKYKYDESITVTANEQDAFFQVAEVAIGEIFPELRGKLHHLSHGMLRLPSGKMSSRTGEVITADSLINYVKEKIFEKIKDRDFSEKEKERIAEIIAIGAIKYSILRQAIGGDIIFDFDKSISFEGDSGPYVQYTAVRANSILEKAGSAKKSSNLIASLGQKFFSKTFLQSQLNRPENFEITDLEKYLYRFREIVERAGREYAPHYIVTYVTELSSIFNSFYAKEKILDKSDPNSEYKITLTLATYLTLKTGLKLLGIKTPERM